MAITKILKSKETQREKLRKYEIPKLNFDTQDYIDLVDWETIEVTQPLSLAGIPKTWKTYGKSCVGSTYLLFPATHKQMKVLYK